MDTQSISLKSISRKIRQYLSGKYISPKSIAMKNNIYNELFNPEGEMYLDFEAAYKDVHDLALKLKSNHSIALKLPPYNPNERGMRELLEWCIDADRLQQQADLASIKQTELKQKTERSMSIMAAKSSKDNWEAIKNEYGISKVNFGKKINFVKDQFKRKVIFRDIEHAFVLASHGFSKPATILAGAVIEELLRLYLDSKNIKITSDRFADYTKACEDNSLLKRGVLRLTDSVRDFRNMVHIAKETEKKHTITKATAKGAVSSIFTIANDFQ
jgi:hypothetical protein